MTAQSTERERLRLREVAREYRQQGYDVIIDPSPEQVPAFLAAFSIDMLAWNADEHVVVEVRSQESLRNAPELDALARAIQNQDAWRFELVVTNPRDRNAGQVIDAPTLPPRDIRYRLAEARQLADQEHSEAALLLAWSATEALLRTIAQREAIAVMPQQAQQVTKSLFTYGVLDTDQYRLLSQSLQDHTLIVHGYQEQGSLTESLQRVLQIADQLQARYLDS